jgi:hypothetical protein
MEFLRETNNDNSTMFQHGTYLVPISSGSEVKKVNLEILYIYSFRQKKLGSESSGIPPYFDRRLTKNVKKMMCHLSLFSTHLPAIQTQPAPAAMRGCEKPPKVSRNRNWGRFSRVFWCARWMQLNT